MENRTKGGVLGINKKRNFGYEFIHTLASVCTQTLKSDEPINEAVYNSWHALKKDNVRLSSSCCGIPPSSVGTTRRTRNTQD